MKSLLLTLCLNLVLGFLPAAIHAQTSTFPLGAQRILFLGDSNTHAGHYISMIEKELLLQSSNYVPELINLGLPSETCTGLSEPDHPFPRPDVHERIDRALALLKPDVVVACYGMNDGIYYPFEQERFKQYQAGIRKIIQKVHATNAKLILLTPPAFDPLPLKQQGKLLPAGAPKYAWFAIYEDYDSVIKQYADWMMTLRDEVELVIDLHAPVTAYVNEKRLQDPLFTMSPDGVHVNTEGHAVIARSILKAWNIAPSNITDLQLETLIGQRQKLLHDSWLSHVGHLRPGVPAGKPVEEAQKLAAELQQQILNRVIRLKPLNSHTPESEVHHRFYPAAKANSGLELGVDFYVWIPPHTKWVRGVIVHQHGCGDGASKGGATAAHDLHWRALAAKWDCALLTTSYESREGLECRTWCDPRNGSAVRFVQAINELAKQTGHPELAQAPWCLWGHSGGGFWASIMQTLYPERIVAVWLQSGQAFSRWTTGEIPPLDVPAAAYQIPVVACPGFKEKGDARFHVAWDGCLAMFHAYRKKNAPFLFAPDPRTGHECGDSRYLAIPFFDVCLQLRLPDVQHQPASLNPIDMQSGFLGALDGTYISTQAEFSGNREEAVWLPTQEFAAAWKEFIAQGSVSDTTPPSAPHSVKVEQQSGSLRISWQADADFESGLAGFRVLIGEETVHSLPEKPIGRFGRVLFQVMSYHDTPEQPLPEMSVELDIPRSSVLPPVSIISINSVGLESERGQVRLAP